jgi:4-amino-4-deoxy-L-arabinose transferase-like glycosyltransferase
MPSASQDRRPPAVTAQVRPRSRSHLSALLAIVLVAAALRIPALTSAPPGLHQDEAANAWNGWCLLKTGRDQSGAAWPILYLHAFGENRSALFVYALLPFQWLGGLNVWTTRLPSAVGGVLTVLLLYWIVARLFDRLTGLLAAGVLALNPWHIQLTRFGHEASICPLLVCVAVAAMLWAGFPLGTRQPRPSVWRGLLAGIVVGGCCYGYPAIRLFLPLLLLACGLVSSRAWWGQVKTRRGGLALAGFLVGLSLTFGPLAYYHLVHPDIIARRADTLRAWDEGAPLYVRAATVGARYATHFNPDLLFLHGEPPDMASLRGFGRFHLYALPLLLAGLFVLVRDSVKSPAARIALCWLLLYPAGDCLHGHMYQADDQSWHLANHPLRSAPGLCGPVLAASIGAAALGRLLWRRRRAVAWTALALFGVAVATCNVRFLHYFFGVHNRRETVYRDYQVALLEAGYWLRPRLEKADAVFVSSTATNMPYIILMVALEYDPQQWFRDERVTRVVRYWDFYDRLGKLYFVSSEYGRAVIDAMKSNGRPEHVFLIGRPGETKSPRPPVYTIVGPDGAPALVIHEARF